MSETPLSANQRPAALQRGDIVLALALPVLAFLYLASLPRNLGHSDESIYLYEALRLLHGDRLYADMFELITPGWMYLMAAMFWIFGAGITTARLTAAALHGGCVSLLFLLCRRDLGIRRPFALLPAIAYVAIAQPAWQIASQHWLGTFLCIALLAACLRARRGAARVLLLPGLLVGALIGVQQARGVFMGAGVVVWLFADHLLCRRLRAAAPPLPARLVYLAAGAATVVLPLLLATIASAGFEPVWRALVIQPIFNYGGQGQPPWGYTSPMTAADALLTYPRFLAFLPVVLIPSAVRLIWAWAARSAADVPRDLALLSILCLTSMMSIAYFPDFIHIAFISPLFFVAIAESCEWVARHFDDTRPAAQRVAWTMTLLALLFASVHLGRNHARLHKRFRFARDTAFGRVDFGRRQEVELYDELQRRLAAEPRREIYTYPGFLNLYLTLGARNPTRFQFFVPGYNNADQVESVIAALESSATPFIVVAAKGFLTPDDPVWTYIQRAYAPLDNVGAAGALIYRRRGVP